MNKYLPHVYVLPEDDRERQIADGFVLHHRVRDQRIQVMPPAGGWVKVLDTFVEEYIPRLRSYPLAHVVMLIDFDQVVDERADHFGKAIPDDLKGRVFVVGPKDNPETLRKELRRGFEEIGLSLAGSCAEGRSGIWDHEELRHNDADRQRLVEVVRGFLFS